jgi:hypothetical protein
MRLRSIILEVKVDTVAEGFAGLENENCVH